MKHKNATTFFKRSNINKTAFMVRNVKIKHILSLYILESLENNVNDYHAHSCDEFVLVLQPAKTACVFSPRIALHLGFSKRIKSSVKSASAAFCR